MVHVLALRRVELHVSPKGSQEAQDFHILRFHFFGEAASTDAAFVLSGRGGAEPADLVGIGGVPNSCDLGRPSIFRIVRF